MAHEYAARRESIAAMTTFDSKADGAIAALKAAMSGDDAGSLQSALGQLKGVMADAEQRLGKLALSGDGDGEAAAPGLNRKASSSISAGETAAFLVFSEASGGTLFIHWSVAGHINGALAGFVPRKKVPAFKLKQNDGKTELIRDVAAPGAKSKRFFEGWNMFIKAARSFEADFNFIDNLDARPVAIFLNMPSLEIKKVEIGDTVDLMGVKAVASVHKSAETIFSGVQKMETAMFIAKAIEKNGAANQDG